MFAIRFDDPASLDPWLVGGKALGLASMTRADMPVSPGFTVTTRAYQQFLDSHDLREKISRVLENCDHGSVEALGVAEQTISGWFDEIALPLDVQDEVRQAYGRLCRDIGIDDLSVAVRSSATAEDSEGASFAGEYDTFVGIRGADNVEHFVRRCWASAFTARSMVYAWKNGISPVNVEMAVVVQKTVNARAAGVMFTLSPSTGDRSRVVIEAAYGLGLSVVGGEVTPDRYVVAKVGGAIMERFVGDKHIEYLTGTSATPVDEERRKSLCLRDEEVRELARLGKLLERQHRHAVDVEFAVDRELPPDQSVVLLQCRPETYWSNRRASAAASAAAEGTTRSIMASVLSRQGKIKDL